MKNNNYFVVSIAFPKKSFKDIHFVNEKAVSDFSCQGVEEFSYDEPQVDEILGERAYSGGDIPDEVLEEVNRVNKSSDEITFRYYFFDEVEKNANSANDFAEFVSKTYDALKVEIEEEESKDWNEEWRKSYRPIEISSKLTILPEWYRSESDEASDSSVYIYPGMGFGTGTHETTFMCLRMFIELLEQRQFSKQEVCLDFGCGSGILGIAAMKLVGFATDFVDIDKSALDNCFINMKLNFDVNSLDGSSLTIRERFQADREYDLVFANILESVLISEREIIIKSVKKNGHLIVSGILNHQVDSIILSYEKGDLLKQVKQSSLGDWSCLIFERIH